MEDGPMSHTSRRKLQLVFGAAVLASLGFGATPVSAETRSAEESRLVCPITSSVYCYCEEGIEWCQKTRPCRPCP
jgi:hypothetical protein